MSRGADDESKTRSVVLPVPTFEQTGAISNDWKDPQFEQKARVKMLNDGNQILLEWLDSSALIPKDFRKYWQFAGQVLYWLLRGKLDSDALDPNALSEQSLPVAILRLPMP